MLVAKKIIIACTVFVLLFVSLHEQNGGAVSVSYSATSVNHDVVFKPGKKDPGFSRDSIMDSIIAIGKKFIGRPYRSRVYNSWPLDCSGFAAYLYSLFGYDLPRAAPAQALLGKKVPMDSLKKGDLMFFKGRNSKSHSVGHTAIFYKASHDTIYFLHSSSTGIRIDKYNGYAYYTARYLFSKRMELDQLKRIPVSPNNIAKLDSALKIIQQNSKSKSATAGTTGNATTTAAGGTTYIIKKGDSLYAISRKFGTTVDKLCALNGITKTSLLRIGQKIRVK